MSWKCGDCPKWFGSQHARAQHFGALQHCQPNWECDSCARFFQGQSALWQHMNACDHWAYDCRVCDMGFSDDEDRDRHELDEHLYCGSCARSFQNSNNMRMHMNSRAHRGSNISCPFCKVGYTTATGLCHHLERGGCSQAPFLDRDTVFGIVRAKDPGGAISKKLLEWHGSPTYEANALAWNGSTYECYLCHREFDFLNGLNQHLSSPAHQQALYHCPNRQHCYKDFTTLAALMNHLESETCGFTRFENVQRGLHSIVNGNRLIQF